MARLDTWTLDKILDAAGRGSSRDILTMNIAVESVRDPVFREGLHHRLANDPLLAS